MMGNIGALAAQIASKFKKKQNNLSELVGKWPGNESTEELLEALKDQKDLSKEETKIYNKFILKHGKVFENKLDNDYFEKQYLKIQDLLKTSDNKEETIKALKNIALDAVEGFKDYLNFHGF